ncbi:UrcA family protein [Litorimonas sp. RW-G-Af-16]|uniref:UrcA family protein n=1 Tax=Litorimonas sp. RW-G-Af-16 TaxID=3241168 RepID=UPI00390C6497
MTHFFNTATKTLAAIALIGGSLALTTPAFAVSGASKKVSVNFDKSELETTEGLAKVYAKFEETAAKNCSRADSNTVLDRVAEGVCTRRLIRDLVRDVDHADLTAYYEMKKST